MYNYINLNNTQGTVYKYFTKTLHLYHFNKLIKYAINNMPDFIIQLD